MSFGASPYWGLIPHGLSFGGQATAVAVDDDDRVYVFSRGPQPLMVFDAEGNLLRAHHATDDGWDHVVRAHSVVFAESHLFLVDEGANRIERRSLDGDLVAAIDYSQATSAAHSGVPFNRPTDVAVHPETGDMFISDGYDNSAVHRFSPDGTHLWSWGEPGTGPGQFSVPHSLTLTQSGELLVCDRENFRIQVFDLEGRVQDIWPFHRPCAVRARVVDGTEWLFVAEAGPTQSQRGVPGLGNCVWVAKPDGTKVERVGDPVSGFGPGQLIATHMVAVDSVGDIYVAECTGHSVSKYAPEDLPPPGTELPSLKKWVRSKARHV